MPPNASPPSLARAAFSWSCSATTSAATAASITAWLGQTLDLPLVVTGNVHYLTPAQARLHDLLTCIRHRVPLEQAGDLLRPNAEYTLRPPAEMAAIFATWPQALRAALEIAERCQARLPAGPQILPQLSLPANLPAIVYLRRLCEEAWPHRISPQHPRRAYQAL